MPQSRRMSWLEVSCSTAFGYLIAVLAQLLIFPLFSIHIPLHSNLLIGLAFTVVSIIRSFIFRRLFNRWSN